MDVREIQKSLSRIQNTIEDAFKGEKIDYGLRNCVKIDLRDLVDNEEGFHRGRPQRKTDNEPDCQILNLPQKRNPEGLFKYFGKPEKKTKK